LKGFTMKSILSLVVAVAALLVCTAAAAELRVVATTPDLASVAREIGGKHLRVTSLALPTQDPHWVDPRPHLALELAKADLLIITGAELEIGWLPKLLTGSRNGAIQPGGRGHLDASTLVELLEVPGGRPDRTKGDVHPSGNPHYMYDPVRVERVAVGIAKRLTSLDPANKQAYLQGTKRFIERLRFARAKWEKTLLRLRGEEVIAYHKSLVYLADWLELRVIEHVEPRPGIPPNPRHVTHVVRMANEHKVKLLLQEAWFPDNTTRLIAEKSRAKVVKFPPMPDFVRGESYVDHMADLVRRIDRAAGR
jgi:zinc/manganese transport system substrate-binding protein